MAEKIVSIQIKGPALDGYIDDLTWNQLPYALSRSMNKLADLLGVKLVNMNRRHFHVRAKWSRKYSRGSTGADINFITDASAYFITQVSKKKPLGEMKVKIATPSWQIAQQSGDNSSSRTPEYVTLQNDRGNKIKYIAIPIIQNVKYAKEGKLRPNAQHLLNNPIKNRIFILPGKARGKDVVFQRYGFGKNDYRALYVLVEAVKINPKFNFTKVIEDTANKMFSDIFDREMRDARASAKI